MLGGWCERLGSYIISQIPVFGRNIYMVWTRRAQFTLSKKLQPCSSVSIKADTDYRTCSAAQPPRQPRTWCSRVWEKMLVAETAAAAVPNQHSAARNAFVFVLKTDNFWFVSRQYSSVSEHIHSMFAACLLTVHTSEYHVLGCRIRLCRGICSIVCTGLKVHWNNYDNNNNNVIMGCDSASFLSN